MKKVIQNKWIEKYDISSGVVEFVCPKCRKTAKAMTTECPSCHSVNIVSNATTKFTYISHTDKFSKSGFSSPKAPELKGHIKLTLHNVHNGKNEVYEGENIVTNALADIMAANYMGGIDYSKIFGSNGVWKKFFGGVLCYATAHALSGGVLDPDDYFPKSDANQHLTAHAGQTPIDVEHDDDFTRGNPTISANIETENSIKQVFEWGTTHGNGNIAALSLTHADTGSYGLGSASYGFANSFNPFEAIQGSQLPSIYTDWTSSNRICAMYDDNHGIDFHAGGADEYVSPYCFSSGTDKLTVTVRRLPYKKAGLFETFTPRASFVRSFTVEDLPFNLYTQPSFYFDKTNKYLWIFSNITGMSYYSYWDLTYNGSYSKKYMNYAVIDCKPDAATLIVDSGVIQNDDENFAPTSFYKRRGSSMRGDRFNEIVYDGTYFYFPASSDTPNWIGEFAYVADAKHNGFVKINLSGSSFTQLRFNTEKHIITNATKFGDLLVENNRVVNGTTGYSCQGILSEPIGAGYMAENGLQWQFQELNKICSLVFPLYSDDGGSNARYLLASKLINSTKFNLPSTVQKTSSQSMTVEYTLTEQ